MAKATRSRSASSPDADALHREREEHLTKARAEVQGRIDENEAWHEREQRKGARQAAHRQDREQERMAADRRGEGTVVVERETELVHVGQEELGMGKLKLNKGIAAGATQPPARGRGAYTVPTTTTPDGRPLVFTNPASGTAMGTQQAKASGAQQTLTGGPSSRTGTIMADFPTVDQALPTFSDRVVLDSDISYPSGGITPSGASNLPRARFGEAAVFAGGSVGMKGEKVQGAQDSAEVVAADKTRKGVVEVGADRPRLAELVASDRRAESEEEMTSVVTPTLGDEPVSGGGELLGMGPTQFLGGPPHKVVGVQAVDRHVRPDEPQIRLATETETALAVKQGQAEQPKAKKAARGKGKGRAVKQGQAEQPKAKKAARAKAPETKVQAAQNPKEGKTDEMEIETKDVKSNPTTEQKDKPVETGTKSPQEG